LLGHRDFAECLRWLRATFSLGPPPTCANTKLPLSKLRRDSPFKTLADWLLAASTRWEKTPPDERNFIAAVKACLIAVDVAGSALPRTALSPQARAEWVAEAFGRVPQPDQLRQIVADRLKGQGLRPFQAQGAASTARVTFVRAGCGTGKTVLAYEWGAQR